MFLFPSLNIKKTGQWNRSRIDGFPRALVVKSSIDHFFQSIFPVFSWLCLPSWHSQCLLYSQKYSSRLSWLSMARCLGPLDGSWRDFCLMWREERRICLRSITPESKRPAIMVSLRDPLLTRTKGLWTIMTWKEVSPPSDSFVWNFRLSSSEDIQLASTVTRAEHFLS